MFLFSSLYFLKISKISIFLKLKKSTGLFVYSFSICGGHLLSARYFSKHWNKTLNRKYMVPAFKELAI